MTDVHKVTIQVRAPKGNFPGEVAIGHYVVVDGALVMTDETGKPVDSEKHHLTSGQDARLLACRLVRAGVVQAHAASTTRFNIRSFAIEFSRD
jgi:hypothetical protein